MDKMGILGRASIPVHTATVTAAILSAVTGTTSAIIMAWASLVVAAAQVIPDLITQLTMEDRTICATAGGIIAIWFVTQRKEEVLRRMRALADCVAPLASLQQYGDHGRELLRGLRRKG